MRRPVPLERLARLENISDTSEIAECVEKAIKEALLPYFGIPATPQAQQQVQSAVQHALDDFPSNVGIIFPVNVQIIDSTIDVHIEICS